MSKYFFCFLLLTAMCKLPAFAQTHVAEPAVNLGDTSFLDGLAGPGWVVEVIGDGEHSGKIVDSSGNSIPDAPDVNSISGLNHIAWLSQRGIFKAWYGAEVVLTGAHVNAGDEGSAGGLGDTTVSPFILQWKEQHIGSWRIDQRLDLDFDLPTGEYSRASSVNVSSHAFTVHPYYAVTVFPAKHVETSWRVHYLWNSTNTSPPTASGYDSTQAGQAIHLNATTAYELPHHLWIGANGYFLNQVTAPKINGIPLADSPERVAAIGPGAVWNRGHILFYANAYHEFGTENRAEGNKAVLRVEWIFGK
jgi:hypothetical protein